MKDAIAIVEQIRKSNYEFYKNIFSNFKGAQGEERATNEFRNLPDTYYVINDVYTKFDTPITIKQTNQTVRFCDNLKILSVLESL